MPCKIILVESFELCKSWNAPEIYVKLHENFKVNPNRSEIEEKINRKSRKQERQKISTLSWTLDL